MSFAVLNISTVPIPRAAVIFPVFVDLAQESKRAYSGVEIAGHLPDRVALVAVFAAGASKLFLPGTASQVDERIDKWSGLGSSRTEKALGVAVEEAGRPLALRRPTGARLSQHQCRWWCGWDATVESRSRARGRPEGRLPVVHPQGIASRRCIPRGPRHAHGMGPNTKTCHLTRSRSAKISQY